MTSSAWSSLLGECNRPPILNCRRCVAKSCEFGRRPSTPNVSGQALAGDVATRWGVSHRYRGRRQCTGLHGRGVLSARRHSGGGRDHDVRSRSPLPLTPIPARVAPPAGIRGRVVSTRDSTQIDAGGHIGQKLPTSLIDRRADDLPMPSTRSVDPPRKALAIAKRYLRRERPLSVLIVVFAAAGFLSTW